MWWIIGAVLGLFLSALRAEQRAARRWREAGRRAVADARTHHEH